MSEHKHTKGKWEVISKEYQAGNYAIRVKNETGKAHVQCPYIARTCFGVNSGEELANAHLIAAAPEMLAFLEETMEENSACDGWGYNLNIYEAGRLIAKAKGETE